MGGSIYWGTMMEHLIKMDDLGVPLFQDTPISQLYIREMLIPRGFGDFHQLLIHVLRGQVVIRDRLGTSWNIAAPFSTETSLPYNSWCRNISPGQSLPGTQVNTQRMYLRYELGLLPVKAGPFLNAVFVTSYTKIPGISLNHSGPMPSSSFKRASHHSVAALWNPGSCG